MKPPHHHGAVKIAVPWVFMLLQVADGMEAIGFLRVPGCSRGGGVPEDSVGEDWGTLRNIRGRLGESPPPRNRILLGEHGYL